MCSLVLGRFSTKSRVHLARIIQKSKWYRCSSSQLGLSGQNRAVCTAVRRVLRQWRGRDTTLANQLVIWLIFTSFMKILIFDYGFELKHLPTLALDECNWPERARNVRWIRMLFWYFRFVVVSCFFFIVLVSGAFNNFIPLNIKYGMVFYFFPKILTKYFFIIIILKF